MIDSRDFNEQYKVRLEKLNQLKEENIKMYRNDLKPENTSSEIFSMYDKYDKEELDNLKQKVVISGRIMTNRNQGKAGFATYKDASGSLQLYFAKNNLSDEEGLVWKKLDIGDIIWVSGEVMKTKVGSLAIRVKEFALLTKSLRPLPDKFHGLTHKEDRYRKRYLDLIMNQKSMDVLTQRSLIISKLREILIKNHFLEVETPILQTLAGGASAKPFVTHHNSLDIEMYLRIATEINLKKLIIGGYDRVFEIGRLFRNEGMSIKHNPEFTSVELYQAYGDMDSMMAITETLIKETCLIINPSLKINYLEKEIDLTNFNKIHMVDIVQLETKVNFREIHTLEEAVIQAKKNNVSIQKHHFSIGHILNEFFEQKCEETIIQPTFVYGHPIEVSPLSKLDDNDPRYTERFELFIDGREYANAFSELNDPIDQLKRFEDQVKEERLGNTEATGIDYDFIEALEYGMVPTGGLGIGIDRLVMLLTNSASIRDVMFFPTMKNRHESNENEEEKSDVK